MQLVTRYSISIFLLVCVRVYLRVCVCLRVCLRVCVHVCTLACVPTRARIYVWLCARIPKVACLAFKNDSSQLAIVTESGRVRLCVRHHFRFLDV